MSEDYEWTPIDETTARRRGVPRSIPVPRGQIEELAGAGLGIDRCRTWVSDFLLNSDASKSGAWRKKNSALVSSLEAFVDKAPLRDKAQKAFAEKDYARAITALKRIAAMDQDDHGARFDLAFALAATGDFAGALKVLKAIKKTFERVADYHVAVGKAHLALDDRDAALSEMARALDAQPDCQAALDAMAQMGIGAAAEYLSGRRAEAAARAEERARVDAAARAEEKARIIAADGAAATARASALRAITSALDAPDTPPRTPKGSSPTRASRGMRDDPLDTSRLPGLSEDQRQRLMERGKAALAEAARAAEKARAEPPSPEQALTAAAQVDALLSLVDLEPDGPGRARARAADARDEPLATRKEKVASARAKPGADAPSDPTTPVIALDEKAPLATGRARGARLFVVLIVVLVLGVALAALAKCLHL